MDQEPTQPPPPWESPSAERPPAWPADEPPSVAESPPAPGRRRRRGRVGIGLAWVAVVIAPLLAVVIGIVLAVRGRRRRQGLMLIAAGLAMTVAAGLTMTTYRVPGASMTPTLKEGDQVLATRIGSAGRGDIVSFHPPLSQGSGGGLYLKRIVAVGGETIGAAGGRVYVCTGGATPADSSRPAATPGCAVPAEPYLKGAPTAGFRGVRVPAGSVFVLDDNRRDPIDSRLFGPVPRHSIVARVLFEYRGTHVGPV